MELNTIELYELADFQGRKKTIHILQYSPNRLKDLNDWQYGSVGSIKFKLQSGLAVTLTEKFHLETQLPYLDNLGFTYDLYGTGQANNLQIHDINNTFNGFFYRQYDPKLGLIKLYEKADYQGNCTTLFISDWWRDNEHNSIDLQHWSLKKKLASYKTIGLRGQTEISLFSYTNGCGDEFEIRGTDKQKTSAYIGSFKNKVAAFQIKLKTPNHTTIKLVQARLGDKLNEYTWFEQTPINKAQASTPYHEVNFTLEEEKSLCLSTLRPFITAQSITVNIGLPLPKAGITVFNTFTTKTQTNYHQHIVEKDLNTRNLRQMIASPLGNANVQAITSVGKLAPTPAIFEITNYYKEEYENTRFDRTTGFHYEITEIEGILAGTFYSDSHIQVNRNVATKAA